MNDLIYLDYNATTPLVAEVKQAMIEALECYANPSSNSYDGEKSRQLIGEARSNVARLINAEPSEIFFTSGASESANWAIKGVCEAWKEGRELEGDFSARPHIITSRIEHPVVLVTCQYLAKKGAEVTYLPVDKTGLVDPDAVEKAIKENTALITIMLANNEIGVIQPVKEIGEIARNRGIPFHSDASQAVGKIDVDVHACNIDLLTVAAQKFYGPKGAGALFISRRLLEQGETETGDMPLEGGNESESERTRDRGTKRKWEGIAPFIHGGGQEEGKRAGTEALHQIVGLGKAAELAYKLLAESKNWMQERRDQLERLLTQRFDSAVVNAKGAPRLPNTLSISIPGIVGAAVVDDIKERVAISAGSACHSGTLSAVLLAIGLDPRTAGGTLRISVGRTTSPQEVETAAQILISSIERKLNKQCY